MRLPSNTDEITRALLAKPESARRAVRYVWLNRAAAEQVVPALRNASFAGYADTFAARLPLVTDVDVADFRALIHQARNGLTPQPQHLRTALTFAITMTKDWDDVSASAVSAMAAIICMSLTALFPGTDGARRSDLEGSRQLSDVGAAR